MRLIGSGIVARRNGSRASSTFSLLFPNGHAGFTRLSGARLLAEATRLERLIHASSDETVQTVVARNGDELTVAIEAAETALEALGTATEAEIEAKQVLRQVKTEWVGAYFRAQRAFEAHFSDDPSLAESYFVRFDRIRKSADDDAGTGDVDTSPEGDPVIAAAVTAAVVRPVTARGDGAADGTDELPYVANM